MLLVTTGKNCDRMRKTWENTLDRVDCRHEAPLRPLTKSVIQEALRMSGSPTEDLPSPIWVEVAPSHWAGVGGGEPPPMLVALASFSFFVLVWRELSGPPSHNWAPFPYPFSGHLEISWLSCSRSFGFPHGEVIGKGKAQTLSSLSMTTKGSGQSRRE